MTPLQMSIMMAAKLGNEAYLGENPKLLNENETWRQQCTSLLDEGLIAPIAIKPTSNRFHLKLTAKGDVWFDAALSTPMPVSETKWIIPK